VHNFTRTHLATFILPLVSLIATQAFAAPPNAVDDVRQRTNGFDLVINVLDNDSDPDGDSFTVTNATGASNGTVTISSDDRSIEYKADADSELGDSFTYTITDENGETDTATVSIIFVAIELPSFAGNSNETSIATAIESLCANIDSVESELTTTEENILLRCNALYQLAASGQTELLTTALQQIAPEEIAAQMDTTQNFSKGQGNNLKQRLSELKHGGPKVSTAGLHLSFNGQIIPKEVIELLLGLTAKNGSAGNENSKSDPFEKLGFFINGNFGNGDREATVNESAYESEYVGLTLGADYRLSSSTIIGLAYGYSSDEVDFSNNGGATDTNSSTLMLFGTYYYKSFYVDTFVGYGWGDFDSFRNIVYNESTDSNSTFSTSARSNAGHHQLFYSIASSMDFNKGALTISPYGSIDYAKTNIDSFIESNGGGWDISFSERSASSLQSSLGSRANYVISTKRFVLIPQIRIAWVHEFNTNEGSAQANFVSDPAAEQFDVTSDGDDSNYFKVALGTSVIFTGGLSGFFEYETRVGLSNFKENHYSMGIRVEASF